MGIYDLLALALELLPEVVCQSAGSFAHCGRPLAVGCVVSVVALRDVALGRSSLGNTHSMFFVVVIFLDLPPFWSPLGVPRKGCSVVSASRPPGRRLFAFPAPTTPAALASGVAFGLLGCC